jgi:hypothetical protein
MRPTFHPTLIICFILCTIFGMFCAPERQDQAPAGLSKAEFLNPPLESRPGALWPWLNGHVDLKQITQELEEMKAKGMRGAIIWDVGSLADPEHIIPVGPAFLGEESLNAIHHALDEAGRLGLELGIFASSSWNAGGAWIEPEHGSRELSWSVIRVSGPSRFSDVLPLPEKTEGGFADVAVFALPASEDKRISDKSSVKEITGSLDDQGRLIWDVPDGEWHILRFIERGTGQLLECPSPNSNGLVIDHLSSEAAEKHIRHMVDRLREGREHLHPLNMFMLDSYEVRDARDWTPDFIEGFTRRRGYDPRPYLPVLADWTVLDSEISGRFLHDYKKTVSDLIIDEHFVETNEILDEFGLLLLAEGGHGGYARVDPLKALGAADIPMGEFWNHRRFWVTKEAASAAHIYGKKLVNAESLTGWQHWQDGPAGYKRLFDIACCAGLNQVTFHTFAHNPPDAGLPGYAYHAGEHFNVNSTWWPQAGPMLRYMARCCYMLQQGTFIGDACFYYGDQAPNLVPSRRIDPSIEPLYEESACFHCGRPKPIRTDSLGPGYDYDYVNEDVILNRMRVRDNKIVLPDGPSYHILVLPEREDISLPVLTRIGELVEAGATVVGPKPSRSVSLENYPGCDQQVRNLAAEIWGSCDGETIKTHDFGLGRVIWNIPLRDVLIDMGVGPDFTVENIDNRDRAIDYIHRQTDREDLYFVSNSSFDVQEVTCTFRVKTGRLPSLWNPDTGRIENVARFCIGRGTVTIPLRLEPLSSTFVVFEEEAPRDYITKVEKKPGTVASPGFEAEKTWKDFEIEPVSLDAFGVRIWSPGEYVFTNQAGRTARVRVESLTDHPELDLPWTLKFPEGWGAPGSVQTDALFSWPESEVDGIKYFSGTALYSTEFRVPDSLLDEKYSLHLDLGDVKETAEVRLNGELAGILWKPPYRIDISEFLAAGPNRLEIAVTNLWNNRIVGDHRDGTKNGYTRTNLKAKFNKESPLLPSGLLGPVALRPAVTVNIDFAP